MPLPELPINIEDPTHDTQRKGTRDDKPVFDTQRGGWKKDGQPPQADYPDGHTRYND